MFVYVSLMVTTKQKLTVDTQKREEMSNHTTTENDQVTRRNTARKVESNERITKHSENNY